jgi:hypothetical protein
VAGTQGDGAVQGIRMPDFARFLAGKLGLAGIDQT